MNCFFNQAVRVLIITIFFTSGCTVHSIEKIGREPAYLIALSDNRTVVIYEGIAEPKSIGTMDIKLYKNLNVGQWLSGLTLLRDGSIFKVEIVKDSSELTQLMISTVSAGSGSYIYEHHICIAKQMVNRCPLE